MVKGAYLHIPFCEHICYYCDFNKVFLAKQPVMGYLEALNQEMKQMTKDDSKTNLQTLFVGGGTPTALNNEQMRFFIDGIAQYLYHPHIQEFTMEANPGNLDQEKLKVMKDGGVNRLSIGVQTFKDELLKEIGRTHKKVDIFDTIRNARTVGFDNISIDLMFGLPHQSIKMLKESIDYALSLDVEHISIYSLQIEPKTIFYNRMKKGELKLPGEDIEADMYELIIQTLTQHGYSQYEVSNFAKDGYQSKHNLLYWGNEEYYGFGAGAHGYVKGRRVSNTGPIKKYIKMIQDQGSAQVWSHEVSPKEKMEEEMFLGLRRKIGVSKSEFERKYKQPLRAIYGNVIDQLIDQEMINETDERIFLTEKGFYLGNEVFQAFLLD